MRKLMSLLSLALGVSLVLMGGISFAEGTLSDWERMTTGGLHAYALEISGPEQVYSAPSDWEQMTTGGLHAYAPEISGPEQVSSAPSDWERMTTFGLAPAFH
jgi:hypothetical protein